MNLRIGTRKSALALCQAERVEGWLRERGHACELLPISTEGDRILDRSLAEVGGKGLFIKDLEQALADRRADLAVHSAKDVPFALSDAFVLSAFCAREDPRDALIAPFAKRFANLPRLARATGATLLRGGVEVRPAEGDPQGPLDAVVLALAGLRRLGLDAEVTEILPPELSLPAAGQGALAIETLRGSPGFEATAPLDDAPTARCVRSERAVLARLAGGCTVPVAAYALLEGERIWLRAALGGPDGKGGVTVVRAEMRGSATGPEALGKSVAEALLDKGGAPLLEAARSQASGLPAPKRA